MKVKELKPEISCFQIELSHVAYRGEDITIGVRCNIFKDTFQAYSDEPYFISGQSFWARTFGEKQAVKIKQECIDAVEIWMSNHKDAIIAGKAD
jgi:hypothetical protein